jgi:hypothetical protein
MSQFLRDEYLKNLNLDDKALIKIKEDLDIISDRSNKGLNLENQEEFKKRYLIASYIIRFDNKGFRLFDFSKVLKYFDDAHRIERVIFILETGQSLLTNRLSGDSIEIRFDSKDANNCILLVQSDDDNWVDSNFLKLKERINRYKNRNFIIRNRWTPIIIQLSGVTVGFLVSLWVAIKISPKLQIENSLAFAFVIAFLIFSNLWTFLLSAIRRCLDFYWPNVSFKRIKGIHWLIRAFISTALISIFLFLLNKIFFQIAVMLKSLWKA